MHAEVNVVELLGAHSQLTTTVAGQRVRVTAESDFAVKHGDTLWLRPHPERIRWYNQETGQAL